MRAAGVRALWLGVEDMTATLVKKGQSVDSTSEAFSASAAHGICPMPMMMHTRRAASLYAGQKPYGLLTRYGFCAKRVRSASGIDDQRRPPLAALRERLYLRAGV